MELQKVEVICKDKYIFRDYFIRKQRANSSHKLIISAKALIASSLSICGRVTEWVVLK
jgi:hypothetical protein